MVSKIYPKHLSPMLKRKKSHKQNINNPKPKKHKHETTWEESYKAKIREEVEGEYIEREKNIQQREHKVLKQEHKIDKKEHELKIKLKWAKDNTKKIMRQPRDRAERDLFLQVRSITREEIFPKIKFITSQDQLDNFGPGSLGYYFVEYCKKNCPTSMVSMEDGDFWNHIKNIVYVTLGSKRNAMQSSLKQKFKGMSMVIMNM